MDDGLRAAAAALPHLEVARAAQGHEMPTRQSLRERHEPHLVHRFLGEDLVPAWSDAVGVPDALLQQLPHWHEEGRCGPPTRDCQLTRNDERGWRATSLYTTGMEHTARLGCDSPPGVCVGVVDARPVPSTYL
jgi:hypothetical protein